MEPLNRQKGGLYRHVHVSLHTLNRVIVALIAVLCLCLWLLIANNGFVVSFDTAGGTAVEPQKRLYGETVTAPPPLREGYVFTGWYTDSGAAFHPDRDPVTGSMTLHAGWTAA